MNGVSDLPKTEELPENTHRGIESLEEQFDSSSLALKLSSAVYLRRMRRKY